MKADYAKKSKKQYDCTICKLQHNTTTIRKNLSCRRPCEASCHWIFC